jgi:hypothetical protein
MTKSKKTENITPLLMLLRELPREICIEGKGKEKYAKKTWIKTG